MLNSSGFNLWADDYDKSVNVADDDNLYPFAGYKELMNIIYGTVMQKSPATILDVGIGTGTLAFRLYEGGNQITGIDFSSEMLKIARAKMPDATLIEHDFTKGLPDDLRNMKFDFVISTYALHHLTDEEKIPFIISLADLLNDDGRILIGDVSFRNRDDLEKCKEVSGDDWDDDEFYFVFSELNDKIGDKHSASYTQISHCAGVLVL